MRNIFVLITLLSACIGGQNDTSEPVRTVAGCEVIEKCGACQNGPVCVPVADAELAGVAFAWQIGGTGECGDWGEADDGVSVAERAYIQRDEQGDMLCVTCEDIDGDTGPSEANPWPYLTVGVCEFETVAEADAATYVSPVDSGPSSWITQDASE